MERIRERRYLTVDIGNDCSGTAIVYNSLSEDLGGFREMIAPGACASALSNDVFLFFNHDTSKVLGRTSAGTLSIVDSPEGIKFSCDLPNTTVGNDIKESLARRDIRSCSFGFYCIEDEWNQGEDGVWVRTVTKADVFELSIVPMPAYTATSVRALLFPDGTAITPPATRDALDNEDNLCECGCAFCLDNNCADCDDLDCDDDNCGCDNYEMMALAKLKLAETSL